MSHIKLREEVIKLRLQGYTYGQIKRELGIAKSTLSDWLRNLPLSENQITLLSQNTELVKDLGREKFRQTFKDRRHARLQSILKNQEKILLPLTERELLIAGLFLYWGEGTKQHGLLCISNTNPQVIKFAIYWMTQILKIPTEKLRLRLHLYKDMNISEEIEFWSHKLNISLDQFAPSYIKKSSREGLTYKSFGHGTCNLFCSSIELSEKIALSIKVISEFYGEKSDNFWYN